MTQKHRVFANLPHIKQDSRDLEFGTRVLLSLEDSHHLLHVLRMKIGDEVFLHDRTAKFNPSKARIIKLGDCVEVEVCGQADIENVDCPVASIVFALSKGDRNDIVCQKATELGVPSIVLWQSERSIVRIESEEQRKHKLERWRKIAESAARQSGQRKVPEVKIASHRKELFEILSVIMKARDKAIYCSLSENSKPLHNIIIDDSQLHLIVGPEGDLSASEEESFSRAGFIPTTLGPSVLRSETAAIVSIAMAQALWRAI